MRKHLSMMAALSFMTVLPSLAESQTVEKYLYAGPYAMQAPVMVDTTDVNGKAYAAASLLKSALNLDAVKAGEERSDIALPGSPAGSKYALHMVGFDLINRSYLKGQLKLEKAPKNYELYIDGKSAHAGDITLEPDLHHIVLKYLSEEGNADSLKMSIDTKTAYEVAPSLEGKGLYTVRTQLDSRLIKGAQLSPDGKYMILSYQQRASGGDKWSGKIIERQTGRVISERQDASWMPTSNLYYYTRKTVKGRELVTVNPATSEEKVLCSNLPNGSFVIAPTEDYLIMMQRENGPKELNPDVYEMIHPEDRQPGFRNRTSLAKFDLKTGVLQPLTFGHSNVYPVDFSADGSKVILSKSVDEITAMRPTVFSDVYMLDVNTLQIDTLVQHEGFARPAGLSPDGKYLAFTGSPESFDRIGCTLPADKIPNEYDVQLFLMDMQSKEVKPMTRLFNPAIQNVEWSKFDGQLYFTAEHRDSICLYRMNPKDGKIQNIPAPEDLVNSLSLAQTAPVLAFYGVSASNSDRLYTLDTKLVGTKKNVVTLVEDLSAKNIAGIELGECLPWSFTNSIGDTVYCRFYLPVGFDEAKSYPMIVNYYGGCSPTSRTFESNYPQNSWAALGYVALIVEPSGASGFGQEWGSRHVNTAGVDPARDIIEAVKEFCKQHSYVNEKKIGCIGASYGGFMTMYLQTVTDIFACAISHAGISDHSNYWGLGDWGYTYSQVSMADSYPWTRKDLYVDQSPLYRVDKIHTPLLFLHGVTDNNVPYNNSLQMFTALKLLGRETALVSVTNQQHHILDYDKRIAWHNATMAWFAKWLQDDPTWWEALYPKKDL